MTHETSKAQALGSKTVGRTQATATLARGSQVVLYTDGLIERRHEDLRVPLDGLAERCAVPLVDPGSMGDYLLASYAQDSGSYGDDVAILTAWLPD